MAAVKEYIGADVLSLLSVPVFIMVRQAAGRRVCVCGGGGGAARCSSPTCPRAQSCDAARHYERPPQRGCACDPPTPRARAGALDAPTPSPPAPPHPPQEPTTMLQKMSEVLEYAGLLDAAAAADDPIER